MRRRSVSREEGQQWAVGLDARREGGLLLHHQRRDGEGMQGLSGKASGVRRPGVRRHLELGHWLFTGRGSKAEEEPIGSEQR